MLQLKPQSIKIREKSCIKINITEINRVLSTNYLTYIHWAHILCYTQHSLL